LVIGEADFKMSGGGPCGDEYGPRPVDEQSDWIDNESIRKSKAIYYLIKQNSSVLDQIHVIGEDGRQEDLDLVTNWKYVGAIKIKKSIFALM